MSFDAFYMVHAAHMTCHTQYEYVGCEAGKEDGTIRPSRGTASTCRSTQELGKEETSGRTTRTLSPNARGGRLDLNFDFTTPELPCGRVTRLRVQNAVYETDCARVAITVRHTPRLHELSSPVPPSWLCRRMLHAVRTTESNSGCR